jgi:outer membrane protein assembly factor BamB
VVVAFLVAAAALFGVARWMLGATHAANSSNGGMRVAWSVPAVQGNTQGIALAGSWLTDQAIVDGRPDGLIAYGIADGAQLWGLRAPTGLRACQMSATVSDHIAVIGYGPDQYTCDQVAAVDLTNGKQLWRADLADHSRISARLTDPSISVSGDIVAVRTATDVRIYGLTDGKPHWATPKQNGLAATTCTTHGVAAGPKLVYAIEHCLTNGAGSSLRLVGYDRARGTRTWQADTTAIGAHDSVDIASTTPLILADHTTKQAYVYPAGTTPVAIDLTALSYEVFNALTSHQGMRPHAYAIVGDVLYAQGADQKPLWNSIVAIDLTTGRQLWSKQLGQSTYATLIGADAQGVHAMTEISGQQVYQLVTYAAATCQVTKGASTTDARFTFTPQDMLYLTSDGHLIDLPASTAMAQREIIVLSGAK